MHKDIYIYVYTYDIRRRLILAVGRPVYALAQLSNLNGEIFDLTVESLENDVHGCDLKYGPLCLALSLLLSVLDATCPPLSNIILQLEINLLRLGPRVLHTPERGPAGI